MGIKRRCIHGNNVVWYYGSVVATLDMEFVICEIEQPYQTVGYGCSVIYFWFPTRPGKKFSIQRLTAGRRIIKSVFYSTM